MAKKRKYDRISMAVPERTQKRIAHVLKESECESMAELIRWALATYDDLLAVQNRGGEIVMREGKSEKVLKVR